MSSRVSACSTASGVPHTTTTSPSLKSVSGAGSRPTMPSRRTALTDTWAPRPARSATRLPTAQACGGRMTLCSYSRVAGPSSKGSPAALR